MSTEYILVAGAHLTKSRLFINFEQQVSSGTKKERGHGTNSRISPTSFVLAVKDLM